MQLLIFTLAINETLAKKVMQTRDFTNGFVNELVDACLLTERRLHSRTGGLLECIRGGGPH